MLQTSARGKVGGGGRLAVCHLSLSCPPPLVVPPQSMHSPGRSLDCAAGRAALLRSRPIIPSYRLQLSRQLEVVSDAIAVQPHQRLAHALAFKRHCLVELPFKFQQSTLSNLLYQHLVSANIFLFL
jgi:hypothetical protein